MNHQTGQTQGREGSQEQMGVKLTPEIFFPGSSKEAAAAIGGKGDFGIPADDTINREYVSRNTKAADRGAAQPRSGEDGDNAARTSGAGGPDNGVGSSSGGDIDTDIVGIATNHPN